MSKLSIVACWHTSEYGYGYGKVERLTRHILGHFGDGGVTEASARIVATVSAEASSPVQPHSVCSGELCCATTVDNSGVYVCYLKGLVSVYFRYPSPPLDNIRVMVIVWRLRGNIIRTAACWVV